MIFSKNVPNSDINSFENVSNSDINSLKNVPNSDINLLLIKLYLNDGGLLTGILYHNNILPILNTGCSINLGSVYESVVAQELKAHGYDLFYYDHRKVGEVDFLISDYETLSPLPIEVKSGKDYTVHSALDRLLKIKDYGIKQGIVLSNSREIRSEGNILYLPIYCIMAFDAWN